MIAPLEKFIDWSSVQVMTLMMPAKEYDWRLEEALRFLKGPDFVPTDSQPAQVEFNGPVHSAFPLPVGFSVARMASAMAASRFRDCVQLLLASVDGEKT